MSILSSGHDVYRTFVDKSQYIHLKNPKSIALVNCIDTFRYIIAFSVFADYYVISAPKKYRNSYAHISWIASSTTESMEVSHFKLETFLRAAPHRRTLIRSDILLMVWESGWLSEHLWTGCNQSLMIDIRSLLQAPELAEFHFSSSLSLIAFLAENQNCLSASFASSSPASVLDKTNVNNVFFLPQITHIFVFLGSRTRTSRPESACRSMRSSRSSLGCRDVMADEGFFGGWICKCKTVLIPRLASRLRHLSFWSDGAITRQIKDEWIPFWKRRRNEKGSLAPPSLFSRRNSELFFYTSEAGDSYPVAAIS